MYNPYIFFIFSVLITILFAAALAYFFDKRKQKKLLQKIRKTWGNTNTGSKDFNLIETFSQLTTTSAFHTLNTQTINDIDIQDLFTFIDKTNSKIGQQYLYNKLITPTNNIEALEKYNEQVNFFTHNEQAREEAQILLQKLNHHNVYYVASLLNENLLEPPKWAKLFVLDTVIVILMLLFSFKFPVLLIWLMIPLILNLLLHFLNKENTAKFIKSFPPLNTLINVSQVFLKKDIPFSKDSVQQNINNLSGFKRKYKLLNFGEYDANELLQILIYIFDFIKAVFLIEIHALFSTLKELKNRKKDINGLINYIGSIDAALSTASLRAGVNDFVVPIFSNNQKVVEAKNIYHPLINNCVENSISINGKSILITGSNMSGKSTFIRTIAINSILAQTIYTCFASEFTIPILKVFSSIRINDSIEDATSYYLEEVNTIGNLIKESDNDFQHLFIIDEVFKGTNTIERIAGAKAILSYLNKNENIVFVSTHDIELAELLKNEYEQYHFVEDVENDKLVFDHKIKTGPLKTRNAIKILALANYPSTIIEEAKSIANKI
jgi:DNA mismatch repair ATPase MutS